jgi:hypothetical protein
MKLSEAVSEYQGNSAMAKGIRRAKWREGTWLKMNDHGVRDDLVEVEAGESHARGYTLNAMDIAAYDWELVK